MGFGPAVVKNEKGCELHHVSSSQINTYEACPHRWYSEKVDGMPSFADWSWAESGVAAHEILEEQVGAVIGKEFNEDKRRVLDPAIVAEAEDLVSRFSWEDYFEEHNIVDVEMDIVLNLNTIESEKKDDFVYPLFVGAMDVVSINKEGVTVVTDWKTGYGADKGVDIQAQAYALGIMQNLGVEEVIFRRIYPRLTGEERGIRKVEEYYFNLEDAKRYLTRIKHTAKKMARTAKGEIAPMVTPSESCVHCPVAYKCPKASQAAFSPKELAEKRKVLKAALGQVESAMKRVADEGDFFVGDEKYGYSVSEFYRNRDLKSDAIPRILFEKNPELLAAKAKVSVDEEVKEFLESVGHKGFKYTTRKSFAWLNEKELKDAAKAAKKEQTTIAKAKKEKEKADAKALKEKQKTAA